MNIHSRYPDCGADAGGGLRISHRYGVSGIDFDAFLENLLKNGEFCFFQQNSVGGNRYAVLEGAEQKCYLSHSAFDHSFRLISDDGSYYSALPEAASYEKRCQTTLWVMALDYSHREVEDGNGMCYVLQLADGRFLIWDGGYAPDAPRLYEFLCAHNLRGGKPVIAGWIMTHSHVDHYSCFKAFTEEYASHVELQNWIANPCPQWMFHRDKGYDSFLNEEVFSLLEAYGDVQKLCPHSGQKFSFCDAELEVLFTWEDHFPRGVSNMNDTSLVLRLRVGETTLLFPGDAVNESCDLMSDRLGSALKSDYVQVPHHGYSGGTVEFYQLVDPAFALWPTSEVAFSLRTTGEKYQWIGNAVQSNKYLFDQVGEENCFVSDSSHQPILLGKK